MDGKGFDAASWSGLRTFAGACATAHDVDQAAAVFALGDTLNGRPLDMELPQPVIWWDDDEDFAAIAVQAEAHETDEGETLEVLGLVLPDGRTAVALLEDVDLVDASDPVWLGLLEDDRAAAAEAAEPSDDDAIDAAWDDDDTTA